jgi:hypothetical protein
VHFDTEGRGGAFLKFEYINKSSVTVTVTVACHVTRIIEYNDVIMCKGLRVLFMYVYVCVCGLRRTMLRWRVRVYHSHTQSHTHVHAYIQYGMEMYIYTHTNVHTYMDAYIHEACM